MKIDDTWAIGFDVQGVGMRFIGLAARAGVRVRGSLAGDHTVGMLIEDCEPRSVTVKKSFANYGLATGILLQNSDGIVIQGNQVVANPDSGIEIDATSNGNRIVANQISGSTADVVDAGSGNGWKRNTFTTGSVPACP